MKNKLNDIILVMNRTYQRDLSVYEDTFLFKTLEKRQALLGIETTSDYCRILEENATEAEALYSALHINFSLFFRDPLTFALLEQNIIPTLVSQKTDGGEIRVWSAGCASGQEAYSIAMLLAESVTREGKAIPFRIIATDVSKVALDEAQNGVYDLNSLRNVKMHQLKQYFLKKEDGYQIIKELKQHIFFGTYDLLDVLSRNPSESIYGDFDLIFCSNLLFYYTREFQQFITTKLRNSMSDNGYLITGEAEREIVGKSAELNMITPHTAIFKKSKSYSPQ